MMTAGSPLRGGRPHWSLALNGLSSAAPAGLTVHPIPATLNSASIAKATTTVKPRGLLEYVSGILNMPPDA